MLIDLLGDEYSYEIYLCKPCSSIIATVPVYNIVGCLSSCAYNVNVKTQMQNINEIGFDIGLYWNDLTSSTNDYFDLIKAGMVIKLQRCIDSVVQSTEYFYIYQTTLNGGEKEIKNVKCYSTQYKWGKIKIMNFTNSETYSTTRKLYDGQTFDAEDTTKGGIMDYIIQQKLYSTWRVSYMSASLYNKYRTFDISEQSLLDVVKTIEDMYNCIFFYDTVNNSIRILAYDELPTETGLIISDKNYLKSISQDIKIDEIVTRLYPKGKDDITIAGVTITGQSYIDDFSYFKSLTYMSQGLLDALSAYDILLTSKAGEHAGYLASLVTLRGALTVLENQLTNLQPDLLYYQNQQEVCIRTAPNAVIGGKNYTEWHTEELSQQALIDAKELEITNKNAEITAVGASMAILANTVSYTNVANFSTSELQELLQFINEETVQCDTDDDTELLEYAEAMLEIKATPPIEFSIDMVDIFSCKSENYTWNKLTLGSLVDLEFEDFSISSKPRIVEYTHNIDSNSLSVTISNKTFFNDALQYISTIFAFSKQSSITATNERDTYKEYNADKDTILYDGDTIDTTDNEITNENGSLTLNRRGIFMKKIANADGQMRIFEDKILATNDNWVTYSVAITSAGIQCSEFWTLTNTDGSVHITENTIEIYNMTLDMYTDSNLNRIRIDPTIGIELAYGTTPVFYTHTDGQIYAKNIYLESLNTTNRILINPDDGIKIYKASTPVMYADVNGDLYLQNAYFMNGDESIKISPDLIEVTNGRIIIKNTDGTSTILDEYGIDPNFLDYFKNMIFNSSFEVLDATTGHPKYWSDGTQEINASFHGSCSLKLIAGQDCIQQGTNINPDWWDNTVARVSFYRKGGSVTIKIADITNGAYFTLTDENGNTGTEITFANNTTWVDSRASVSFDPASRPTCANVAVYFRNDHATDPCYIDAVQLTPDFTGKWSQLYKDGQYSVSAGDVGDFSDAVTTIINETNIQAIYVQNDPPATPVEDDVWIDTNDYSRYDLLTVTSSRSLLMSDEEFVVVTNTGVTLTLETPTQNGVVKLIKNVSTGIVTISGAIDNLTNIILFPYEGLSLVTGSSKWYRM